MNNQNAFMLGPINPETLSVDFMSEVLWSLCLLKAVGVVRNDWPP